MEHRPGHRLDAAAPSRRLGQPVPPEAVATSRRRAEPPRSRAWSSSSCSTSASPRAAGSPTSSACRSGRSPSSSASSRTSRSSPTPTRRRPTTTCYSLTDAGRARAKVYFEECSYVGTAPGPVRRLRRVRRRPDDRRRAAQGGGPPPGLLRPADLRGDVPGARPGDQLGPRHVPLRLPRQRQDEHRRADHPLLRHDDLDPPGHRRRRPDHQALRPRPTTSRSPRAASGLLRDDDFDHRWIEITPAHARSPAASSRMEDLEIHFDPVTKISEAPLQLKSNNGTFLIDDFGRQRMPPDRAAQPLDRAAGEARTTSSRLPNGKKIQVPFDQLILFSTNLEPKQLVRRRPPGRCRCSRSALRPARSRRPCGPRRSGTRSRSCCRFRARLRPGRRS